MRRLIAGLLLDPFFLTHRALRNAIAGHARDVRGIVIDVGCGAAPYRSMFSGASYIGLEIPEASSSGSIKRPDVLFDGRHLPMADQSADAILCSQVLEHVFEPIPFLQEIRRVLRHGGTLLLTVPFVWDEHEQPYDYARYSSFGLHYLASSNGFEVEAANRTLPDASLFLQLWLAYIFKVTRRLPNVLRQVFLVAIIGPSNVFGMLLALILPASPDLYLDNVMVWRKLSEGKGDVS